MEIITKATKQATWEELKAAAEAGTIDALIQDDAIIPFTLKSGEKVAVRVTHDETGKMFFVFEDCLEDEHSMNDTWSNAGGWAACKMRTHLNTSVFALFPDDLQAVIAPTKIVQILNGKRVETKDKLFIFSRTQAFGKGSYSACEPEDTQLNCFRREKDRVKECGEYGTWMWWLRSAGNDGTFYFVGSNGSYTNYDGANGSYGVALGFCLI